MRETFFTVLGTVAEWERSLIVEHAHAGVRNARVKGKVLGRPRVAVDALGIAGLHSQGRSTREIADEPLWESFTHSATKSLRRGGLLKNCRETPGKEYVAPCWLATIYTALGHKDSAFRLLETPLPSVPAGFSI